MGRKTTVWTFQATNKRNLTQENFKRETVSLQRHKD